MIFKMTTNEKWWWMMTRNKSNQSWINFQSSVPPRHQQPQHQHQYTGTNKAKQNNIPSQHFHKCTYDSRSTRTSTRTRTVTICISLCCPSLISKRTRRTLHTVCLYRTAYGRKQRQRRNRETNTIRYNTIQYSATQYTTKQSNPQKRETKNGANSNRHGRNGTNGGGSRYCRRAIVVPTRRERGHGSRNDSVATTTTIRRSKDGRPVFGPGGICLPAPELSNGGTEIHSWNIRHCVGIGRRKFLPNPSAARS